MSRPPLTQAWTRIAALAAGVLLVVLAVIALARSKTQPASNSASRIVVTHDATGVPVACGPRGAALSVSRFAAALSHGDGPQLDRSFAPRSEFVWYSVTEGSIRRGRHRVIRNRDRLLRYFAGRRVHGEWLRLRRIEVAFDSAQRLGQFTFNADRRGDDLRKAGVENSRAFGKGAVSCSTGRIVVWSMAMAPGRAPGPPDVCRSAARAPADRIVACAR